MFNLHPSSLLIFSILIISSCASKDQSIVIAKVGDIEITADEFRKRFEFNPRLKQFSDKTQAKYQFLGSLIAEKLLALEAKNQGLPDVPRVKIFLDQLHREAVIEELYNRETASRIQVSDEEIRQAYARSRKELEIQSARFTTLEDATEFRKRVVNGESFDLALSTLTSKAWDEAPYVETLTLRWGQVDQYLEDTVYEMKPGDISEPIEVNGEFYVARVLAEKVDAFGTEDDYRLRKEKIEKIVLKRKRSAEFLKYFKEMMSEKETNVPPERFKMVVEKLVDAFRISNEPAELMRVENPAPLTDSELSQAWHGIEGFADEILVFFEGGFQLTVREFVQRLSVGRYYINFNDEKSFKVSVRQALITMIEQEYVYQEGTKDGIGVTRFVMEEVAMWRENLAAYSMMGRLLSQDHPIPDQTESIYLTDGELATLTHELLSLLDSNEIAFDTEAFEALDVSNAGLLLLKTHFPGRMVVPVNIPLENLQIWQEAVLRRLARIGN
jgi:hypothetical protein